MRVGFITQLLWSRYGHFWLKLFQGAEADTCFPVLEQLAGALKDERVTAIPGLAFQLAAAQTLTLEGVDLLVVPDLNANQSSTRGAGQDPWIASFPETLRTTLGSLPPVVAVPATLEPNLESLAVSTLHTLLHDPALVRRVWERHKRQAKPPRYPEPRWQARPSEGKSIGLIGQPWLFTDAVLESLRADGRHLVGQHQFAPERLRQEGERVEHGLIGSDQEVLGAARLLSRKGDIGQIWMIADQTSGSDAWLARRVAKAIHKPLELRYLQDLFDPASLVTALASGADLGTSGR